MASSARKAFWLLKSFNHVGTVITMIETYSHANDECYANLLDILEQLFLVLYYFYENLVFMARTKLVGFTEDMIDDWGNWSWFVGDFVCFAAAVMRMYISHRNLSRHVALLPSDNCLMISRYINGGDKGYPTVAPTLPHADANAVGELRRKYYDSLLSVTIVRTTTVLRFMLTLLIIGLHVS
jgi:hypothetical protein